MRVVADRVHAHFWVSSGGLLWTWMGMGLGADRSPWG